MGTRKRTERRLQVEALEGRLAPGAGGGGVVLVATSRGLGEEIPQVQVAHPVHAGGGAVTRPVSARAARGPNSLRHGLETHAIPVAYGSNGIRFGQEGDAVQGGTASPFQKVREA